MAVTLLRHTTPDVEKGVCYGRTDLALASSFEAEFSALMEKLPRTSMILTSPLTRCRILAERIGQVRGQPVTIAPDWIEMDFGRWEGIAWSDIPRAELNAWAAAFHDFDGHGGESVAALEARVRAGLEAMKTGTLVVTHAGCIKAACAIRQTGDGWDTQTGFGQTVTLSL